MTTRNILVKNTIWLGLVEGVSKVIMFLVTVSIVRYLGPADFGTYNIAFAYVSMFMILGDFGLGTVTAREVAKHKDKSEQYLGNLLGLKLALSGIIAILIVLSLALLQNNTNRVMILAVMMYNLSQNLGAIFSIIFGAWEKMELVFWSRISYYLGVLISASAVIALHGSVLQLVMAYTGTTILSGLFSAALVRKLQIKIHVYFDKVFWKQILRETVPFMGLAVVGTIYGNNDTLLIGRYFGNTETGFYQSAYKILFAFQSINVINNAIFPRINVLLHENKQETLNKLIKVVVGYSVLGLVPLATIISVFQNQIVGIIYGPKYLVAAPAMAILVWSGVINYFRILTSNLLFARNAQKQVFFAVGIGLIFNLLINVFILPRFGFVASAWGMLISEIAILSVTVMSLKRSAKML